ncbi:MAG TPA: DUF1080 domain-containing protein [Polyangiaceae bacterium]|nr:DUF1080 domain-containing protein [Polyangiaceae bacterium]
MMKCLNYSLPGIAAIALAAACSDNMTPSTSGTTAGSGGQVAAGSGGSGVVAGTSGTPLGGTPPAVSGAAGTVGTAGGGAGGAGSGGGGTGGGGAGGGGGSGGDAGGAGGSAGADGGWVPLFNGMNLDGWTPGASGNGLFAVDTAAGEPAIHVYPTQADQSNQPQAHLRTNESYGSYVLHVEYKWGTKRFAGRAQSDRDNGICFHIVPPVPNNDQWPTSIEFQLGSQAWPGDWVSGNIFMLVDKTRAKWTYAPMMGQQEVYSPTGTKKTIGAPQSYYKALSVPPNLNKGGAGSSATPATEWNVVELTVHGSKDASYNVNGTVVNGLTEMEYDAGGGNFMPLDHGAIALQAEFAEVYFRNVKIKVLQ